MENRTPFLEEEYLLKLKNLKHLRESGKIKAKRKGTLNAAQRRIIFEKTGGLCHICGIQLDFNKFQADHVKPYTSGGIHDVSNFLPACNTCNNYRWHYLPEEIQIILHIGVILKTQIVKETPLGKMMLKKIVHAEQTKIGRRRKVENG